MIGKRVQKYRIERELGSGAMGAVYEAIDTLTERPVAMKVLRAELARQPELIDRFRSEAVTLARLNHPNIAILYDFFLDGEDYYMAMEFVRGQPLESVIRTAGRLEPSMAARIMSQTLEGLAHAHSMGVLHRDIKPANIMVTGDGRVKVTDFGIARVLGSSRMTRTGRIIGTLEYIAPERIRGDEADPRSDLYSAGVVLYEMLTGRLPFTAQTDFELIKAQLEQEPTPVSNLLASGSAAEWDAVVQKAMAKSSAQRYQSAEEFGLSLPDLPALSGSGTRSPAIAVKPTRFPPAEAPVSNFAPAQQEPAAAAWQSQAPAAPVKLTQKIPPMALVLGAAGILAVVLLMAVIVMRIRASNEANGGTTPASAIEAAPPSASQPSESQKPIDSNVIGQPTVTIPVNPSGAVGTTAGRSSVTSGKTPRNDRREAALRALEGKDAGSKNSKRSAALKALDQ
jgi:eukaryotic-like serine/threonine-protein kinase